MGVDFYNCDACGSTRHPNNLDSCANWCGVHYCNDGLGCSGSNLGRTEEDGELYCEECLPKCFFCYKAASIDDGYHCEECDIWFHNAGACPCPLDFGAKTNDIFDSEACPVCADDEDKDVELPLDREAYGECGIDGCTDIALIHLDTPCGCGYSKGCVCHFEQHVCDRIGASIEDLAESGDCDNIRAALVYLRGRCGDKTMEHALAKAGY